MDEKKKMMVLGGLGLALVCVAIPQFVSKGAPVPPPAAVDKATAVETVAEEEAVAKEGPKNPALFPLNRRDPFAIPSTMAASLQDRGAVAPVPSAPRVAPLPEIAKGRGPSLGGAILASDTSQPAALEAPQPEIAPFGYRVAGVVLGRVPAAVFVDAQGGQRLIAQGSKLDPDSTVKAVSLGQVVVSYYGKTLRLPVGEVESNAQ